MSENLVAGNAAAASAAYGARSNPGQIQWSIERFAVELSSSAAEQISNVSYRTSSWLDATASMPATVIKLNPPSSIDEPHVRPTPKVYAACSRGVRGDRNGQW